MVMENGKLPPILYSRLLDFPPPLPRALFHNLCDPSKSDDLRAITLTEQHTRFQSQNLFQPTRNLCYRGTRPNLPHFLGNILYSSFLYLNQSRAHPSAFYRRLRVCSLCVFDVRFDVLTPVPIQLFKKDARCTTSLRNPYHYISMRS